MVAPRKSYLDDIRARAGAIQKQLRAGRLTPGATAALLENYAYIYKDDDRAPVLGMGRGRSAEPDTADDDTGIIWFTTSTLDEDRDGDVVVPRGRHGEAYEGNPVWFFGHQQWEIPVGTGWEDGPGSNVMVEVTDDKIRQGCRFDREDPDADYIYGKVKRGFLNATSIAFVPIEAHRRDDVEKARTHTKPNAPPGWVFVQWGHTETSIVGVGSNAGALRDDLDQNKGFITPRCYKALGTYAAQAKGRCFSGWCPCPETSMKKGSKPNPQDLKLRSKGSEWYVFDEVSEEEFGPFKTADEARTAARNYASTGAKPADTKKSCGCKDCRAGHECPCNKDKKKIAPKLKPALPLLVQARNIVREAGYDYAARDIDHAIMAVNDTHEGGRQPTGHYRLSLADAIKKYIRHEGDKWVVHAESGKVLGRHDTKESAEAQLRAVEANKHKSRRRRRNAGHPDPRHKNSQADMESTWGQAGEIDRTGRRECSCADPNDCKCEGNKAMADNDIPVDRLDLGNSRGPYKATRKGGLWGVVSADGQTVYLASGKNDAEDKARQANSQRKAKAYEDDDEQADTTNKGGADYWVKPRADGRGFLVVSGANANPTGSSYPTRAQAEQAAAQLNSGQRPQTSPGKKQLSEASGSAGGYTVHTSRPGKVQANGGKGTPETETVTGGYEVCANCAGDGSCPHCDGHGQAGDEPCPQCGGSGECPECNGMGQIVKATKKRSSSNESYDTPYGLEWRIPGGKSGRKWFSTDQEREQFATKLSEKEGDDIEFRWSDPRKSIKGWDTNGKCPNCGYFTTTPPKNGVCPQCGYFSTGEEKGITNRKSIKGKAIDSKGHQIHEGDTVVVSQAYGGGKGRVVRISGSSDFIVIRTRDGDESVHGSDVTVKEASMATRKNTRRKVAKVSKAAEDEEEKESVDEPFTPDPEKAEGSDEPPELPDESYYDENEEKDSSDEPFTPKPSAMVLAKLYKHLSQAPDYIANELSTMDHPGVAEALKDFADEHITPATDALKSIMDEHHSDGDAEYMDKCMKAMETDTDGGFGAETGEENKVDVGEVPPDTVENAEAFAGEETPEEEALEHEQMGKDEGHGDAATDEILERYQDAKGHWRTKKHRVRVTKDGRWYLVRTKSVRKQSDGAYVEGDGKVDDDADEGDANQSLGGMGKGIPHPYVEATKDAADFLKEVGDDEDAMPNKSLRTVAKSHGRLLGQVHKALTNSGKVQRDGGPGSPLTEEGHEQRDGGGGSELSDAGEVQTSHGTPGREIITGGGAPNPEEGPDGTTKPAGIGLGKPSKGLSANFLRLLNERLDRMSRKARQAGMMGKDN